MTSLLGKKFHRAKNCDRYSLQNVILTFSDVVTSKWGNTPSKNSRNFVTKFAHLTRGVSDNMIQQSKQNKGNFILHMTTLSR